MRNPHQTVDVFIALLRGINLGGHKTIRMEQLRACFEGLGFRKVRTYVQSGNVVFEAQKELTTRLSEKIGKCILSEFGFPVSTVVRSAQEMEQVVRGNPFVKQRGIDTSKLHITFLSGPAPKAAARELAPLAADLEQFHLKDREIYLYCPNGYGRTKLSNNAIEKKLGFEATTRNWKSVNALLALARE
ncbi:MAG TPA: DUF1697 domain-containing protein [Candidatus Limnocylindrales bacterium]|jgi:uncharacterized protein (DUF1697 family)|nr:DUF1697 domain-containing protein [Candidatus Limnocylindrales bacterium]